MRGVLACGGHSAATRPPFVIPQEGYSSTSWEIKELQVRGGRVTAETEQIGEFTRANCVKEAGVYGPGWTEWHECPSGQLMTGVRMYRYEDKWFTGMSAICKIPQRSVPPRKPIKDAVGF
jgi:hypothetical protein